MGEYAECTSHNPPDRGLYTEIDLCQSADYVSLESRFAVFIAALIWLFSALVKRQNEHRASTQDAARSSLRRDLAQTLLAARRRKLRQLDQALKPEPATEISPAWNICRAKARYETFA